jgi:hypothetical protein
VGAFGPAVALDLDFGAHRNEQIMSFSVGGKLQPVDGGADLRQNGQGASIRMAKPKNSGIADGFFAGAESGGHDETKWSYFAGLSKCFKARSLDLAQSAAFQTCQNE